MLGRKLYNELLAVWVKVVSLPSVRSIPPPAFRLIIKTNKMNYAKTWKRIQQEKQAEKNATIIITILAIGLYLFDCWLFYRAI